jgi:hypothetical protein
MTSGSESGVGQDDRPAKCPEPLCSQQVLSLALWRLAPPQRTLLLHHRSYRLMRQTKTLLLTPALASFSGSLQVVVSLCWEMALPDIISAILA